jgi:hypothetical protein|tara:strand:- start:251 stop:439 length:189 start_codon:yes stop_codon:yes gene_type:complete
MISNDIKNIKFTIVILFIPDVHNAINSLSFSNFIIVKTIAIKKQKGNNFVKAFDIVKKEYKK